MKLITREEFSELLGVTAEWTYKINNFPEPDERIKRTRGRSIPMWSLESVQKYAKTKERLDYNEVKRLNDKGITRTKMAEILKTTTKKLGCYCRYHKIVSLSTVKDIKARKAYALRVQGEFWPTSTSKSCWSEFLDRHVQVTQSLFVEGVRVYENNTR